MNKNAKYAGLALAIILVPGGFLLGATLAVKHIKKQRLKTSAEDQAGQ